MMFADTDRMHVVPGDLNTSRYLADLLRSKYSDDRHFLHSPSPSGETWDVSLKVDSFAKCPALMLRYWQT